MVLWSLTQGRIKWGTFPDWVAGVGGMLAFFAVVGALLWERHKHTKGEDARTAALRRKQAEGITYYLEAGTPGEQGFRTPVDAAEFSVPTTPHVESGTLVIINSSGNCVYGLIASAPGATEYPAPEARAPEDVAFLGLRGIGVIPPGITKVVFPMQPYSGGMSTSWRSVGDFANNKLVPWIEFTDQRGVCWRRLSDGSLDEVLVPMTFPDYSP
jgi:hypothetical protein